MKPIFWVGGSGNGLVGAQTQSSRWFHTSQLIYRQQQCSKSKLVNIEAGFKLLGKSCFATGHPNSWSHCSSMVVCVVAQQLRGCSKAFLPWQPCENRGHSDPVQSSSSPSSPSPSDPHCHHPGSSAHALRQRESRSEGRWEEIGTSDTQCDRGNVKKKQHNLKIYSNHIQKGGEWEMVRISMRRKTDRQLGKINTEKQRARQTVTETQPLHKFIITINREWTAELCLHYTRFNSESGGVDALITHSDEYQMTRNK